MMNMVEMLDPESGKTFVAVADEGKLVPYAKVTGRQLAALVRDRDDLLAALKGLAESDRNTDPYIAARALIARIEAGNG